MMNERTAFVTFMAALVIAALFWVLGIQPTPAP